jgi:hypothetical protein
MPLLQWAEPTEVLGLARLRGPAHLALLTHGKNRGGLLPHQRRWFELDGVAVPSTDEGGAIDPHGQRRAGFVPADDGEQSDNGRAESTREVAKVKLGSCPYAPTRGISMAGPHGTTAIGGVRSPSCDRARWELTRAV